MTLSERGWVVRHIDQTVKETLAKYTGGQRFFDALDAHWRTTKDGGRVVDYFFAEVPSEYSLIEYVSTGRFGMYLNNKYILDAMLVTGGLRSGAPMDRLEYVVDNIQGRNFCLLDDSFYSGRTRSMIKAEIERLGGKLVATRVIYDGSKTRDLTVTSLYRYYDYYDPKPWLKNPNVRRKRK
jgi:hypothetical protein